jgi:hypothetical protein
MQSKPSVKFEVKTTHQFQRDLKQILKRYPDFTKNIQSTIDSLGVNPVQGDPLGSGVYKLRIEIEGKGHGERYGARLIHAVFSVVGKVYLMRVYDKSDKKDLSPSELKEIRKLANAIQKTFQNL